MAGFLQNRNARGTVCVLLGATFWGFSGACGQYLFTMYGVDPFWLSAMRMTVAGPFLVLLALATQRDKLFALWKTPADVLRLIFFGIAGLFFCQITYLLAIQYSNAGTATVLQYLGPVFLVLVVCIRQTRLPRSFEVLALVCAFLGTFLLATHGNPSTMVLSEQGLFWGLMSALGIVLYSLSPVGLMQRYGSLPVVSCGMVISGLFVTIVCKVPAMPVVVDGFGWVCLAMMVVFGTALAFTLYFQGIADVGATKASILCSIEAVSATVFATVWLGTQFSWIDLVGFALIMSTVFTLNSKSLQSDSKP